MTWNNVGTWGDTIYDAESMGGTYWDTFDITALVKDWKTGVENGECGFVMTPADSTTRTSVYASETTNTDNRPYVVFTYANAITLPAAPEV